MENIWGWIAICSIECGSNTKKKAKIPSDVRLLQIERSKKGGVSSNGARMVESLEGGGKEGALVSSMETLGDNGQRGKAVIVRLKNWTDLGVWG